MNVWVGTGRATKDASLSESGKQAMLTLACDRPYPWGKDKDGNKISDFLTLKILGEEKAKRATQYIKKGTKIDVHGIVCRDSWKDNNGDWKEMNYIIVQDWEFAESKAVSQQNQAQAGGGNGNSGSKTEKPDTSFLDLDGDDEDGVPFM